MTTDVSTNPTSSSESAVKNHPNQSLITGILLIVLGIIGITAPVFSTFVAETWIALIVGSAGTAKLFYAFQTRDQGGFIWKVLLGALYIATAIMLFLNPFTGIVTLTLFLGSFLLTEGVFELILAFRLRPQSSWVWALGNAIVTLLLGAVIVFQWPFNAPWLLGTLVGASILFTGISRVMLSIGARSGDRPHSPISA